MRSLPILFSLTFLGACSRRPPPAPGPAAAPSSPRAEQTPTTDAGVLPEAATAAVATPRCRAEGAFETIDDGQGRASRWGTEKLESLRVLVDADVTAVTWDRQGEYTSGDSARVPVLALSRSGGAFRVQGLPVRSYACATSGYTGTLSAREPFVTWGVLQAEAFQVWGDVPAANELVLHSKPIREIPAASQPSALATNGGFALASVAVAQCPESCNCGNYTYALTMTSLMAKGARPKKIASIPESEYRSAAPALAMSDRGGVGIARIKGALKMFLFDASGAHVGEPATLDQGDVGAAAAAVSGDTAVVSWAKRSGPKEPYALRFAKIDLAARSASPARVWDTGGASAFAPALVTDGANVVVTWMEGDGGSKGTVRVARTRLDATAPLVATQVSTADETNARDPEISGPLASPTIAYAAFSRERPGGIARVARLRCDE